MPSVEKPQDAALTDKRLADLVKAIKQHLAHIDRTDNPPECVFKTRTLTEKSLAGIQSIAYFHIPWRNEISFELPSDRDSLAKDWRAVGRDLYIAMLTYTMAEQYARGQSSKSEPQSKADWAISR